MADSGDQHQECREWAAWAHHHRKAKQDEGSLLHPQLQWDPHLTCKGWAPHLGGQEDHLQAGPGHHRQDGKAAHLRHRQQAHHRPGRVRRRCRNPKGDLGDLLVDLHLQQGLASTAWLPPADPSRYPRATPTQIKPKVTLPKHQILRIPSSQISRQHTKQLSANGIASQPPTHL